MTQFEMQVRAAGTARVARQAKEVTRLDGEGLLGEIDRGRECLVAVLVIRHIFGDGLVEALQVCVDGGIAVVMRDIDHIAIAEWRHPDTTHIAVGHRIYPLPFHALGLDVDTRMEAVVTQFAEGGAQVQRDIEGRPVLRKGVLGMACHSQRKKQKEDEVFFHDAVF